MPPVTNPGPIHSSPLRGTQIQIFALQPGQNHERLVCYLRTVDLEDNNLSYEAISYVWGSQETPATIICRNDSNHEYTQLSIPKNAVDALEAVREPQSERLIWIDSVCISQTSIEGKSAQVAMMDSIFANAAAVIIWLGFGNDTMAIAAEELFDRMAIWCGDATPGMLRDAIQPDRSHGNWNHPRYTDIDVEILLNVFECEWVWRLWCVQEVVLAKKALVYWAKIRTTWEIFSTIAIYIQAKRQGIVARIGLAGVYNVTMLESFRRQLAESPSVPLSCPLKLKGIHAIASSRRPLPFSRLPSLTRMHGVTDLRDRVFSLLGLDCFLCHMPIGGTSEAQPPLAVPNYAQKIGDLYISTAKKLLCREKSLYLLSFVQHQAEVGDLGLPSWVPQWHVNNHRLITQFDLLSGHPVSDTLDAIWLRSQAPSHLPPGALHTYDGSFHISEDCILQVDGLLLGTVSANCSEATFVHSNGDEWISTLRNWFHGVVSWYTGDRNGHIDSDFEDQVRDVAFHVFYRTIFGGHLRYRDIFHNIRRECEAFRSLLCLSGTESTDCCPTTHAFVTQICRNRKLFFTTDGQLGIGPKCVQPGDAIFSLSSAAVPLLLRPRPQVVHRWALLGEVYVNGMVSNSDDYGLRYVPFVNRLARPTTLNALRSQQPHMNYTSLTCDSEDTVDRNAVRARSHIEAGNALYGNAQNSSDYLKKRDGTCGRVQRRKTFADMPQSFDIFHPFSRVGNEIASHPLRFDVSRSDVQRHFEESSAAEGLFEHTVDNLDCGERIVLLID